MRQSFKSQSGSANRKSKPISGNEQISLQIPEFRSDPPPGSLSGYRSGACQEQRQSQKNVAKSPDDFRDSRVSGHLLMLEQKFLAVNHGPRHIFQSGRAVFTGGDMLQGRFKFLLCGLAA